MPEEQRMVLNLTNADGFISARTLGGCITNMEKLLQATAKQIGDRVHVSVSGMSIQPNGASVEFLIVALKGRNVKKQE